MHQRAQTFTLDGEVLPHTQLKTLISSSSYYLSSCMYVRCVLQVSPNAVHMGVQGSVFPLRVARMCRYIYAHIAAVSNGELKMIRAFFQRRARLLCEF